MKEDITYVACYLALNCEYIWTNDSDFNNKKEFKIINTEELLKIN